MPAKGKVSKVAKVSKVSKVKIVRSSLRAQAKQSGSWDIPSQIASSKTPRNDEKISARSVFLTIPVYSLAGRAAGNLNLPKEIFGQKVNKSLLAQAIRVYSTNQKVLPGFTKTRGEVEGSTAKIYRQKGTGRARHGSIRAPIFVGGGITFGPKPRKARLELPQRMKRSALFSALSSKMADKEILGISGVDKASGKTKEMVKLLNKVSGGKSTLIVAANKMDNVVRAVRNIPAVSALPANLLNAYEVLKHEMLLLTKEAVGVILGSEERTTPESDSKDSGHSARERIARMTIKKGEVK